MKAAQPSSLLDRSVMTEAHFLVSSPPLIMQTPVPAESDDILQIDAVFLTVDPQSVSLIRLRMNEFHHRQLRLAAAVAVIRNLFGIRFDLFHYSLADPEHDFGTGLAPHFIQTLDDAVVHLRSFL